ncbi:MAG: hypothetical protein QM487_13810 [Candidatus Marithrix sp.]
MDNKASSYLRGRHLDASKAGLMLDVSEMRPDAKGTKIIPESKLTDNHILSDTYYITSLDRNTFNMAVDVLSSETSSRVRSPVPKKHIHTEAPISK